jgi:hypothetical protein
MIPLEQYAPSWPKPDDPQPFKHIELEINTVCDLSCFGCDRFSDVTTALNMTLVQVRRFVDESLDLKWEWQRIRFLGGEPTLHPQFGEMVGELLRYRKEHVPQSDKPVFLQVLTNGRGKADKWREWLYERHVNLHAEAKEPGVNPPWFWNTRIAPVDRDPHCGELEPCGIFGPQGCGVGLTRHGYFLDGAGAAVARVAGIDCGVMRLEDVTWESILEQGRKLCRLCGHWNPLSGRLVTRKVTETGEVTGKFWSEALAAYKANRSKLKVYGDS